MRLAIQICIAAVAIFISSCATPYQPTGFTGGFSETQLAPDVFRINFCGNGYTSSERAQDFALLRAADLCSQYHFTSFAILNENDSTSTSAISTPGYAYSTGSAYAYGNSATYSSRTTYSPGQTIVIHKPQAGLLIRGFQTKPSDIFTFDVVFLQKSLKQKYHIQ